MSFDEEAFLATSRGYAAMAANNRSAELLRQLSRTNKLLYLDELCCELTRDKVKLEADNAVLSSVMSGLLDRCEALDRVVRHLQTAWQPRGTDPASPSPDLTPAFEQACRDVAKDQAWPKERARIAQGWKDAGKAKVPSDRRR